MSSPTIDQHVTQICELGCERVTEIIMCLQHDDPTPETDSLSAEERKQVLHELQAIMAIYTTRKGSDGCD